MTSPSSPRILILTASVGAGHIRAAEAVELALRQLAPDAVVRNVDLMTCATAGFRRLYSRAYLDLVSKAPHLLGYFYDLSDRPFSAKRAGDQFRLLVERANLARLNPILAGQGSGGEKIATKKSKATSAGWDIVVNTHFLPAEIISGLRRRKKWPLNPTTGRPVPQFTVVTDFDAHGLWANDPTDRYFVATEEAAISLGRWGVPREIVTITGIPIDPVFAQPKDPAACRDKHQLYQDRPVVLLLAGGFGVGPIAQLFEAALKVERPIHLAVVCGRNETLQKSLARLKPPARHKATVIGFTREMDELLAAADLVVSKPGGLTTSEILARGAAMAIVNPIPGQESRNSDYLLEHGAAIKINSAAVLPYKLGQLLDDAAGAGGAKLAALRANAQALGHPRAAFDVTEAVLAACGTDRQMLKIGPSGNRI
jgi:processive 1,2-diacylglycerol beta-glucosyltransferase